MSVVFPCRHCSSQYLFECKSHHIDCLVKGLGFDKSFCNHKYTSTKLTNETTRNHRKIKLCMKILRNFNHRWRTGYSSTLLDTYIAQVSLSTMFYFEMLPTKYSNYKNAFNQWQKSVPLVTPGVVSISCGFWQNAMTYTPRPPHPIILTHFPYSNLKQTKIMN